MRLIAVFSDVDIINQTGQQIPQHLPKIECDKLRANPDIIGCARPYQLNTLTPLICDYI